MNTEKLAEQLKNSRISPGVYNPSTAVKLGQHIAVMFDGKASVLFGPADCVDSQKAARAIARHPDFIRTVETNGLAKEITVETVEGDSLDWSQECGAVIPSEKGEVEDGNGVGYLWLLPHPKTLVWSRI